MAASGWKEDLSQYGNYYEGWVNDIDDCLTSHAKAIVTCYGTCRSQKTSCSTAQDNITTDDENISTQKVTKNVIIMIFQCITHR